MRDQRGFSVLEMILYMGIAAIIGAVLINFVLAMGTAFSSARAHKEVFSNTRLALDSILADIRYAEAVYTPTSVFGVSPGHLSLVTKRDLPDGEARTYLDYYVSSSRLYVKRESQDPVAVTGERVRVTGLTFRYLKNGTGTAESVQVELSLGYDAPISKTALQASTSVNAAAAVRGAYK